MPDNYAPHKHKTYKTKEKNMKTSNLKAENALLKKENKMLKNLCKEKDAYFTQMISDGLRNGSKLAGKHMSDRKKYINGKY